jgi:aminocarboxymuconate-semialdehyde decarboxylase
MIIDFHNHFYPAAYLRALRDGGSNARLEAHEDGNPRLHYPGDYNVLVPGHRSLEARIHAMDEAGVDVQAISLTTPGVHIETAERGVQLARIVNDAFAEAMASHPGRFAPLAALPLQDPAAAVSELKRAIGDLGLRGALLFSNINGRHLDDEAYLPLFEALAELRVPAFIHPTSPASIDSIEAYRLTALVGFLFDTSVAAARLIFAGVLERFPDLAVVLGHLGGTLPYVVERLDRGFEAYPECRERISRPPSEYLRQMYLDTVNFQPRSLRLALDLMGPERLVFGTDYPHQVGYIDRALQTVRDLPIDGAAQAAVRGGNAARLLLPGAIAGMPNAVA